MYSSSIHNSIFSLCPSCLTMHRHGSCSFFGETQSRKIMYVLICQPVPSGLLSRVIVGTKAHPVYLSKQSRGHVCRFCMTRLLTCFFYTPAWVFPGDPSFLLAVDDIITMSCHFLPRLPPISDESSNQKLSHLNIPLHMHVLTSGGMPQGSFFIQLSERKHLPFTTHQAYLVHFIVFISYIQGKCGIIWHATVPTLLMSQYYPHLFWCMYT